MWRTAWAPSLLVDAHQYWAAQHSFAEWARVLAGYRRFARRLFYRTNGCSLYLETVLLVHSLMAVGQRMATTTMTPSSMLEIAVGEDLSIDLDQNLAVAKDLNSSSKVYWLVLPEPQLIVLRVNRPHGRRQTAFLVPASSPPVPALRHRLHGRNDCQRHRPANGSTRCDQAIVPAASVPWTGHSHSVRSVPVQFSACSERQRQSRDQLHCRFFLL